MLSAGSLCIKLTRCWLHCFDKHALGVHIHTGWPIAPRFWSHDRGGASGSIGHLRTRHSGALIRTSRRINEPTNLSCIECRKTARMAGHLGPMQDQPRLPASSRRLPAEESALSAAVSERLGEVRFGRWFGEDVRLALSGDGDALEVHVPDPFFREWIQSHYSTSLLEAAEAVAGRPVRLSIQIERDAPAALR